MSEQDSVAERNRDTTYKTLTLSRIVLHRKPLLQRYPNLHTENLRRLIVHNSTTRHLFRLHLHTSRRLLNPQKFDTRNLNPNLIPKPSLHTQLSSLILHPHLRRPRLVNQHSIINIKLPLSTTPPSSPRCNHKLKIDLPNLRRRHPSPHPHRQNDTTPDMHWDICKPHILHCHLLTRTPHRRERLEVVKDVVWEVIPRCCRVFVEDGRHEDGGAVEELSVDREGVDVFWVLEPERMDKRGSVKMGSVEGGVDVVDEAVSVGRDMRKVSASASAIYRLTAYPGRFWRQLSWWASGRILGL